MEQSILISTKMLLGIISTDTSFDQDIITSINSAFSTLNQLGLGPEDGFMIEDESAEWVDFIEDDEKIESVKSYVYLRARLLFDPPTTSFQIESFKQQRLELEWRLNVHREDELWVDGVTDGSGGGVGGVGPQGPPGADGAPGADGVDGRSAYEVALDNGFVGDVNDWLASLVGADGAPGADGVDGLDAPIDTDGTLATNSDLVVPSQKAVKTYADTKLVIPTGTPTVDTFARGDGTWAKPNKIRQVGVRTNQYDLSSRPFGQGYGSTTPSSSINNSMQTVVFQPWVPSDNYTVDELKMYLVANVNIGVGAGYRVGLWEDADMALGSLIDEFHIPAATLGTIGAAPMGGSPIPVSANARYWWGVVMRNMDPASGFTTAAACSVAGHMCSEPAPAASNNMNGNQVANIVQNSELSLISAFTGITRSVNGKAFHLWIHRTNGT